MEKKSNFTETLIIVVILVIAALTRVWGIHFGLPHLLARPDEQSLVSLSFNMFSGDLNPHFFEYPSFFIYFLFFCYNIFYLVGRLVGSFSGMADLWLLFVDDPSVFFLIPRYISVVTSLLTVFMLYRLGRRFYSPLTGLVAAFLASGTFLLGREAHFGVTDTTLTLLCLVAIYHCLSLAEAGRNQDFIFTAIFAGLAASTKYPAALLLFPILTAVFLRYQQENKLKLFFKENRSWLLLTIGMITFFAVSPYLIIDFSKFKENFIFQVQAATVTPDIITPGYWFHLRFTLNYGLGWPLLLTACLGILHWGKRRRSSDLIILAFILGYFLIMGATRRPFVRYLLPIVPLLILVAADGLINFINHVMKVDPKLKQLAIWLAAVVIIAPSAISLISFDQLMAKTDTRVLAARWIDKNITTGSAIAIDGLAYSNLNLTESPAQVQTRIAQTVPTAHAAQVSNKYNEKSSPVWYYLYPVSYLFSNTISISSAEQSTPAEAMQIFNIVRQQGVQYLVTSSYDYLPLYTDNWVRLKPVLEANFKLIKQFSPYNPQSKATPRFDQIDAFYVPYHGFNAITNPGPVVNIYQIK